MTIYNRCSQFCRTCALSVTLIAPVTAAALPFTPTDDNTVLEQLPYKPTDAASRELRDLRQALAREPVNLPLALRVAQRDIGQARIDSDPRYLGPMPCRVCGSVPTTGIVLHS